jgi:hypothetical protein
VPDGWFDGFIRPYYPERSAEIERLNELLTYSYMRVKLEESEAENARLRERVEAARAIHQPRDEPNSVTGDLGCRMCWIRWPCPTIAALSDEGKP